MITDYRQLNLMQTIDDLICGFCDKKLELGLQMLVETLLHDLDFESNFTDEDKITARRFAQCLNELNGKVGALNPSLNYNYPEQYALFPDTYAELCELAQKLRRWKANKLPE